MPGRLQPPLLLSHPVEPPELIKGQNRAGQVRCEPLPRRVRGLWTRSRMTFRARIKEEYSALLMLPHPSAMKERCVHGPATIQMSLLTVNTWTGVNRSQPIRSPHLVDHSLHPPEARPTSLTAATAPNQTKPIQNGPSPKWTEL